MSDKINGENLLVQTVAESEVLKHPGQSQSGWQKVRETDIVGGCDSCSWLLSVTGKQLNTAGHNLEQSAFFFERRKNKFEPVFLHDEKSLSLPPSL